MSERLLLIEDSPTQLLTIKRVLELEGYVVITAGNGAEGLARAYNELPDVIVSDVVMSGINGYQLCRLVKNDPDLSATPVILLTKLDGSIDRFWGLKSGANRYIPKEAGFPSLIKAVKEILAETSGRPRLRVLADSGRGPTADEINNRLNQLLERLLFEATIVDEVRHIGEHSLDLVDIAEKLFVLLSSVLEYVACALVVNHDQHSVVMLDLCQESQEDAVRGYISRVALQLGLPPLKEEAPKGPYLFEHALTQPVDSAGQRVGLLVVVPWSSQVYKPGDQKVVRLICEQLSVVLRLYLLHRHKESETMKLGH
ncbi:MAG: response regulator [Candidatus Melainabacteria bacterium]|nr:response regulator [Candidatus Melainabacteria bacterium]